MDIRDPFAPDLGKEELVAFVAYDQETNQYGMMAYNAGDQGYCPMIATKPEVIKIFEQYAQKIAFHTGRDITKVVYKQRVEVETYSAEDYEPDAQDFGGSSDN